MRACAVWLGILGLLIAVIANVISNIFSLLNVRATVAAGAAPEDVFGYGIAPVWVAIGILLGVLLFQGRAYVRRAHLVLVCMGFLALLVVDWVTYFELLSSMGL